MTVHPETWYSPVCYATNAKSRHLLDTTHHHDIFSLPSILDQASALESLYDLPTCRQVFRSHDSMELIRPCSQRGSHCNIVHTGLNLTPHYDLWRRSAKRNRRNLNSGRLSRFQLQLTTSTSIQTSSLLWTNNAMTSVLHNTHNTFLWAL